MNAIGLLLDAYGRIRGSVHHAVDGLAADSLALRPYPDGNSIAWLIWHLTRVQDDHVSDVAGDEQIWTGEHWMEKFGLPFDAAASGYGQSSQEVAAVRADADLLLGYYDAVHHRTLEYVGSLSEDDLDRIVDESWGPPVTVGVRLVSVLADDLQHAGQAAYLRGLVQAQ